MVGSSHSGQLSGMRFTELVERLWSTHFVIHKRNVSSSNLNIPTVLCACAFATMVVDSNAECCNWGVKDTLVWQGCASERRESAGYLKSTATQPPARRSNYQSRVELPSNLFYNHST